MLGIASAAAFILACAPSQPTAPGQVTPTGSASGASGPSDARGLFAVLAGGQWNDGPARHDSVEIVGLDGGVRASATFSARTLPVVGAVPVLQDEARVAAGRVYYADGSGVVRTLLPDGKVAEVARLPFGGGQQELSFAVSPDGGMLEAAVLTLPPPNPGRRSIEDPVWAAGNASIDLYRVRPGQAPVAFLHQEWIPDRAGTPGPTYQAVGYDHGFAYTLPTGLAVQQPYNGRRWFGPAVHIDPSSGAPSAPLGGASCAPMASNGAGVFVCLDQHSRNPSFRNADGSLVWAFPNADENYAYFTFSPAGDRLAFFKFGQATPAGGGVVTRAGDVLAHLAVDFRPRAWLDENTLLGDDGTPSLGGRQLAYVLLSDPGSIHDLGPVPGFAVVGALAS